MFVRVHTGAISGIEAVAVTAEVNVASGGLGLFIVGLPDNTIKESQERIQAAFENSGYKLQAKKTVVNLAPADLRKEGSQYDLPIAIGILTATEHHEIILEGQSDLQDIAHQKLLQGSRHTDPVETEKETSVHGRDLQQRNLVFQSTLERRTGLGVNSHNRLGLEELYCLVGFGFRIDDKDTPREKGFRKGGQFSFRYLVLYASHTKSNSS